MEAEVDIEKRFSNIGLKELSSVAESIYKWADGYKVWLFDAPMGSGKTTLIKALCEYLSVDDHVSSPTFSIVNEYNSSIEGAIYHFDFYRIETEEEVFDIGIEEYFYSGSLCLLEWPELIPSFIPDDYLLVQILSTDSEDKRDIIITKHGKRSIS